MVNDDPNWLARWAHWHSANRYNLAVEQGVGLLYGLAIMVSMGLLSARLPVAAPAPRIRKWTESFSVLFCLGILLYVNLVKNIEDWTRARSGQTTLPASMRAPLIPQIELSALGWFHLTFLLIGIRLALILRTHRRRPLEIVPASWAGRGQMLHLVLLWAILVGNWEKALPAFTEQRLDTEWVMIVNGLVATYLVLNYARSGEASAPPAEADLAPLVRWFAIVGLSSVVVGAVLATAVHQGIYSGKWDGFGGRNLSFGPEADWRMKLLQRRRMHP